MEILRTAAALLVVIAISTSHAVGFSGRDKGIYENIDFMQAAGDKTREIEARVEFGETAMRIMAKNGAVLKEWNYDTIRAAEYSYTKNPRWKTGLGLGAAGVLFPPLWLIALPIGLTKHRRHWVTIRTEDDYAVLKVGKSIRKLFMPEFETRTKVPIKALGDDK